MKKGYSPSDIPQQEGQDQARRLHRSIGDNARRLDDVRGCARTIAELFIPSLLAQRSRLRENCEKLIFLDPILYGRKGEELLWRKVYYDVVSTAKRLKKQEYSTEDIAHLQYHISSGIGYYHHLISKLQIEYDLHLYGIVDFPVTVEEKSSKLNPVKSNVKEWAEQSVHRCLVYLGDLSRYKLEIYPNWDHGLAIRYYLQASNFKPEYGMPHNQLGTLSSPFGINCYLDSTYHFMRCLCCTHVFEGTENNLIRLLDRNSLALKTIDSNDCIIGPVEHIKRFISRFLNLVNVLYFEQKNENVHNLCHEVLLDLKQCLQYSSPLTSENGDSPVNVDFYENDSVTCPNSLNSDIILKIIVICLMCTIKLRKNESKQISAVKAFLFAVYSQLTQTIIERIQGSVFNISLPSPEIECLKNGKYSKKKSKIAKMRRRRIKTYKDDSDLSESESITESSCSDRNSDSESESDLHNSESGSDDEGISGTPINGYHSDMDNTKANEDIKQTKTDNEVSESVRKVRRMDPNDLLEIVAEEGFLQCIKVLCDWMTGEFTVLNECGASSQLLLKQIVQLLNLINLESSHRKIKNIKLNFSVIQRDFEKIPLPEDVILKGMPVLKVVQSKIDWNYLNNYIIEPKEEALLRVSKLIAFGHTLAELENTGITFDKKRKCFNIADVPFKEEIETVEDIDEPEERSEPFSRGKLMKHMGQLWLAAEVQSLESRVQCRTAFSPYLVLDTDVLIDHMHLAKQLVSARKFIVLVPIIVLSLLDELKYETKAREAIRWLETQFHRGNRFLRAQRPSERLPIPLIKYPKKRDKETHTFIQIIECCHYLTQQQKGATNIVSLLMGNESTFSPSESREMSFTGLAHSAGVNMELITSFHAKWKKSMKGHK